MEQMPGYVRERKYRPRETAKRYPEERECKYKNHSHGKRRRGFVKFVAMFLLLVVLFVSGRMFFAEVLSDWQWDFLGAEDWNALSEGEENSDKLVPGEIPLYLQKDKRWRQVKYGSDNMGVTGCGPTCLSMVVCGLRQDEMWMPVKIAEKAEREGYYVSGSGSSWSLMTEGAEELGLQAEQLPLQAGTIRSRLQEGKPIICIMGPGDFTDAGHFIVLRGVDNDGNIIVNDPNSRANSEKSWNLERLMGQMKNLWAYSYSSL